MLHPEILRYAYPSSLLPSFHMPGLLTALCIHPCQAPFMLALGAKQGGLACLVHLLETRLSSACGLKSQRSSASRTCDLAHVTSLSEMPGCLIFLLMFCAPCQFNSSPTSSSQNSGRLTSWPANQFINPMWTRDSLLISLFFLHRRFAIPRSWYIAQKPLEPGKITKSPTPGRAPKIRKKYLKTTKTAQKSPLLYFFGIFFVFSGPDPGWGITYFFRIFFVFPGLMNSIPGTRNHNRRWAESTKKGWGVYKPVCGRRVSRPLLGDEIQGHCGPMPFTGRG